MKAQTKVAITAFVLALPLTWIALVMVYMPQPFATIARFIAAPLTLWDAIRPADPSQALPVQLDVLVLVLGQLLWIWL